MASTCRRATPALRVRMTVLLACVQAELQVSPFNQHIKQTVPGSVPGFSLTQELQGGGGCQFLSSPEDSIFFQVGSFDRSLSHMSSIYTETWRNWSETRFTTLLRGPSSCILTRLDLFFSSVLVSFFQKQNKDHIVSGLFWLKCKIETNKYDVNATVTLNGSGFSGKNNGSVSRPFFFPHDSLKH